MHGVRPESEWPDWPGAWGTYHGSLRPGCETDAFLPWIDGERQQQFNTIRQVDLVEVWRMHILDWTGAPEAGSLLSSRLIALDHLQPCHRLRVEYDYTSVNFELSDRESHDPYRYGPRQPL